MSQITKRIPVSCARLFAKLTIVIGLLAVAPLGCTCATDRGACVRDGDCRDLEVCYLDGQCVPRDVAERKGAVVGDECVVVNGAEVGCEPDEMCRMGFCEGGIDAGTVDGAAGSDAAFMQCTSGTITNLAPLFGGVVQAVSDGADAVVLTWIAAADESLPAEISYRIFVATASGAQDFAAPVATVTGEISFRVTGLTEGQPYYFVVRAQDPEGQVECNTNELSATPEVVSGCIDFASQVQTIFDANCTSCHSGNTPPQGLHLDSYAGVMTGGATGNEIIPCQPSASLLYMKITMDTPPVGVRMPFGGPYLLNSQVTVIQMWIEQGARASCAEPDICSDINPPSFAGLATATSTDATHAQLCWPDATDDITPTPGIVYDAYQATTPGGENYAAPARATSGPGDNCIEIDALSPNTNYCWVVRARDGAGNRDANTVERCVTTPPLPPGCVEYATMIQPMLDVNCTRCHGGSLPPQWLRLDTYENLLSGSVRRNEVIACSPGSSLLIDKISPSPSLGARMPWDGPPYLTAPQIAMVDQWIANGAQRTCSEVASCADASAPGFGGATSAIAVDETTIRVCWAAASDNQTSPESIRYDVYEGSSPGAQSFGSPSQTTVMGLTCVDVSVGPGTNMCFVVRARDLADNRDNNTAEVCATTPASGCAIEYAELIQPILSARCTHCHRSGRPPRFLELTSYGGALAGGSLRNEVNGCDWPTSLLNTKTSSNVCGRRMPADGAPWLGPAERSLLQRWVESGARRSCADPDVCGDSAVPSFAGATSAVAIGPTTTEVCWDAATDQTTQQSSILYEVYEAASPGGQRFNRPSSYAVAGPATCLAITTPTGVQSCFVVRARDLAGNRDANTVERCATTPGACFTYDDTIQPIFDQRCVHCHSGNNPPRGIRWDTYAHAIADAGAVRACNADGSNLNDMVETCQMPRDTMSDMCATTACLTPSQQRLLRQWVDGGADQFCPWGVCP